MLPLILFILMTAVIVILLEWRERQQKKLSQKTSDNQEKPTQDPNCCGMHLVCEKMPPVTDHIVYYDDEELDSLKDIPASEFTEEQVKMIEEVYSTLSDDDLIGWTQSLAMRHISLPAHIYDEALIILREKRKSA